MPTYTQIGTAVVVGSGGAATIDFTSIPNTYTDLVLKWSIRSASASWANLSIKLNNSTSTYTMRYLQGSGSAASSYSATTNPDNLFNGYNPGTTQTSSTFSNGELYLPNYAGSAYKSYSADNVAETNASTAYMHLVADLWSSTSAVNQITIYDTNGANLAQYSSAYLYGVSNA
jgi:DNA-binding GntR family transcriptional regulator